MTIFQVNGFDDFSAVRPEGAHMVRSSLARGAKVGLPAQFSAKLVLEGEERYRIGQRNFSLKRGQLLLVPEGETVEASIPTQARGVCLYLSPDSIGLELAALMSGDVEAEIATCGAALPPMCLPISVSRFGQLFSDVALYAQEIDAHLHEQLRVALVDLLGSLRGVAHKLPASKPSTRVELALRVERARGFIIDHCRENLSLEQIADAAHLSRYHLSRAFAAAYGEPPLRYHQNLRLDWARNQILAGVSASEVASALGFNTLTSFSRAFLRRHGHRPSHAC